MSTVATTQSPPRRSTRVRAQIPIRVTSLDPSLNLAERCHTLVVNTEGCGVRISQPLQPGVSVLLDELPSGNSSRGRVANCVPLGTEGKYWVVGIALEEPGNIWCIKPAPDDWLEPATFATPVPLPKKAGEWPYAFFSGKGEAHPGRK
ncbi:MAG TPA: PilZ domain-containing protein [Terriglobales bacterium]|nr:PilZ domain-containing protein [Terriglobales bacterium]HXY16001.1 PilZ domain-containing protein [Terriglobales bacterium]